MKFKYKYLSLIFLACSLSLVSCTDEMGNDDNLTYPDNVVSFGTYVGNSRAAVVDASTLQTSTEGFGVMAYLTGEDAYTSTSKPNYMNNQQVVYNNGAWNYSPIKYWPANADEKISFFAYAPYTTTTTTLGATESGITALPEYDEAQDPIIRYEFGSDISQHIDLLYASAKDRVNTNGSVNFEFKHALSRIGFKVCGWEDDGSGIDFDNNTTVTINAITMSTTRHGASLNLASGEWSEPVNGSVQGFALEDNRLQNNVIKPGDAPKQINSEDGYIMIVPDDFIDDVESKRYCVLIDYTVETIDPNLASGKLVVRNKVYRYISPNFEQGKAYTINIHLGLTNNPGSSDDSIDETGPAPVDPNPDDPTVPSTGGKNSFVKFSTTVADWDNATEEIIIPLAPSTPDAPAATFTANQLNLHINGSFSYVDPSEAPDSDVATIVSMIKEGSTENILKSEQSFTGGSYSIPTSNMKLGSLEPDTKYILTLRNVDGDLYTTDITMQFAMMQMTLDIPSAGTAFTMPLKPGTLPTKLSFVWDDEAQSGEMSSLTTTNNTRTFQTAGLKHVKILSARPNSSNQVQMPEFNFKTYAKDYAGLLYSIDTPILNTGQKSFAFAFNNCGNLASISNGLFDNNPEVNDFTSTFDGCSSLQAIPEGLFANNPNAGCFYNTFKSCGIRSIPATAFKNCRNAQVFNFAFANCTSLETIEEGAFDDLVSVTYFMNVFHECTSLNNIPESLFANCVSVATYNAAFLNCTSLESIPERLFYGSPNATDFGVLFKGCTVLGEIPAGLFSCSTEATAFNATFSGCASLTSIPVGLFDTCTKAKNFGETFKDCTSLTTVPKSLFDNNFNPSTSTTNTASSVFLNCTGITSDLPELWNRSEIRYYSQAFKGCVNAANYADVPETWL